MIATKKVFHSDWIPEDPEEDGYEWFDGNCKTVVYDNRIECDLGGFMKSKTTGIVTEEFFVSVLLKRDISFISIANYGNTNESEVYVVNLYFHGNTRKVKFNSANKSKAIEFYEYLRKWLVE